MLIILASFLVTFDTSYPVFMANEGFKKRADFNEGTEPTCLKFRQTISTTLVYLSKSEQLF